MCQSWEWHASKAAAALDLKPLMKTTLKPAIKSPSPEGSRPPKGKVGSHPKPKISCKRQWREGCIPMYARLVGDLGLPVQGLGFRGLIGVYGVYGVYGGLEVYRGLGS